MKTMYLIERNGARAMLSAFTTTEAKRRVTRLFSLSGAWVETKYNMWQKGDVTLSVFS